MLLRWLRARYPSVPVPDETMEAIATHSSWDTHNRITDLFLTLARSQHSEGIVDSDVQTALGVLFYTNGEYERAKDCFETALGVKPRVIVFLFTDIHCCSHHFRYRITCSGTD